MNSRSQQTLMYALIGFLLFLLLCAMEPFNSIMDDAYISLIYARNLATGNGLTYEGGARVEGYSNFLWTTLCSLYYLLPGSVFVWMRLMSLCAIFFIFLNLVRVSPLSHSHPLYLMLFPLLLLCLDNGFIIYAKSGMETPLHSLLILLCVYYYSPSGKLFSHALGFALLLAMLFYIRPEGGIFFLAFAVHQLLFSYRNKGNWPWTWTWIGLATAMVALFLLWRYLYYGDLLPNTYYAKIDLSSPVQKGMGMRYSLRYITYYLPWPVLILAIVGSTLNWHRSIRVQVCALAYIAQTIFIVVAGGDFFPRFRFFAPVAPLLYLLAGQGVELIARGFSKITRPPALPKVIGACIVLLCLSMMPMTRLYIWYNSDLLRAISRPWEKTHDLDRAFRALFKPDVAQPKQKIGTWLATHYPTDTVIATCQAGQIPYYSRMNTIDLCGLNDRYIARNGPTTSYLRAHNVEVIIMEILPRTKEPLSARLIREYDFQKNYRLSKIIRGRNNSWGKLTFAMWRRRAVSDERCDYTKDIRKMLRHFSTEKESTLEL